MDRGGIARGAATVSEAGAPPVAVIILTWNRVDDVVTCLESFSSLEYPNYEVIVIDNASEDDTVTTVRERFPWAKLIVNERNLGYVGGNNVGIRYALDNGFHHVFILNSDTKVTPDVLSELVRVMQSDPRIAIAGAKNLLMEDPTYTWGKYGILTWGPMLVRTHGHFEPDSPEPSTVDVDWVIGNGCLMRREALEEVGLFDPAFFQVNEDVDWSMRARKLGHRVVYVDTAAILHKGASSADITKPRAFSYGYFLGRNALMFARKHASPLQRVKLITSVAIGWALRLLYYGAQAPYEAFYEQKPFIVGVVDGFSGRLRRERITIGQQLRTRIPPKKLLRRFLRWVGA
jgi:GT2 family glycosyltransferase